MAETDPNQKLLTELEPVAGSLLDRHYRMTDEWFPHMLVPYSRGRDYGPDEEWDPRDAKLNEDVRRALVLNLLTEDNLPYYTEDLGIMFGRSGVWGAWRGRWTAEEGRHSIVIRDYLTATNGTDPVALERARMQQLTTAEAPHPGSAADGFVYVTLQELATRVTHLNTGALLEVTDPKGYEIMKRVAADENLHYLFYKDVGKAAIGLDPSAMAMAMERQVRGFEMPGTGVDGFKEYARAIARAGIYDHQIYYDKVLYPVLIKHWKLDQLTGLSPEAEQARERLMGYLGRLGNLANKATERKERLAALALERGPATT